MSDTEEERLQALRDAQILDTDIEERFDRITRIASRSLNTEIALVSLIDENRQWFKSHIGLDIRETPRDLAFCNHAIQQPDEILVVKDATSDPRFADNELVTGDPNIRFYAGVPLVTAAGHALGTLCVIDTETRAKFDENDRQVLLDLAETVMSEIEASVGKRRIKDLQTINQEMQHRMGNLYSHVNAVIGLIGRQEDDKDALVQRLKDNIGAMAEVQSHLAQNGDRSLPLSTLVTSVMRPWQSFQDSGRFAPDFPADLAISSRGALMMSLLLNELATNATKHGGFSSDEGAVTMKALHNDEVHINWTENFKADRTPVKGTGFGMRLITDIVPRSLAGRATVDITGDRFVYTLVSKPDVLLALA